MLAYEIFLHRGMCLDCKLPFFVPYSPSMTSYVVFFVASIWKLSNFRLLLFAKLRLFWIFAECLDGCLNCLRLIENLLQTGVQSEVLTP